MVTAGASVARWLDAARLAAEQGIHNDALSHPCAAYRASNLDDLADVLVADHERKRGERRRRRRRLQRNDVEVAATDPAHARAHANPLIIRERRDVDIGEPRTGVRPDVECITDFSGEESREVRGNGSGEGDGFHLTTRSACGRQSICTTAPEARLYSPSVSNAGGSANSSVKLGACSTSTSGAMTCVPFVAAANRRMRASGAAS